MIKEVMNYIAQADPEIGAAILREYDRQMHNIELIASENIVSGPAMMAMGTVLAKCVIPFLIPDGVKILLAALLVRRLQGHIKTA